MSGTSTIHQFLREARVPYTAVPHPPAFTAQGEAAATYVPGREWAKVVVCVVDQRPIEAVVPAPLMVDLPRLLDLAGGTTIRLAEEGELLIRHDVFVDVALAAEPQIVFSAGSHADAIAMRWADFARTVRPIVGRFSAPPRDRVAVYHLSYRE